MAVGEILIPRVLHQTGPTPLPAWAAALAQLRGIMDDLKAQGVVHGDVHGDNVCVDAATGRLTLLDFGWCLWRGFALAPAERDLLERRLAEDFDWRHFEEAEQKA